MQAKEEPSSTDNSNDWAALRMIQSIELTPQMALKYMYEWRATPKLLEPLLERIQQFCKASPHYLPTAIFIVSLQPIDENALFQQFAKKIARKSISFYLLLRWSFTTYLKESQERIAVVCNRLDSSDRSQQSIAVSLTPEELQIKIKQKLDFSEYISELNDFYTSLFKIPQKLKKIDKSVRNDKLRKYLERISRKVIEPPNIYLKGFILPTPAQSNLAVSILYRKCFTFSTKERVPFKLVIQTISQQEAMQFQSSPSSLHLLPPGQKEESKGLILPASYFGKEWAAELEQIAKESRFSALSSYRVQSYLVKSGDDLRQEHMALQLIRLVKWVADRENLKIWVRPYAVISYDRDRGLIEFVEDTRTVSFLKEVSREKSLRNIYKQLFGDNWEKAVLNFVQSLTGYSLVQYLFQIKDRHNNNILVDTQGHILHIDFSFMLSSSPGSLNFERAPFKLTSDYMEIMEGPDSEIFRHFKLLFFIGLKYIRKYSNQIINSIVIMQQCHELKCFQKFDLPALQSRLHLGRTDEELQQEVESIVGRAVRSYTTSPYDVFQWYTNDIYT